MDTLVKADIFFFITSLAVILITAAIGYAVYKAIVIMRIIEELIDTLRDSIEEAGSEISGLVADIQESLVYRSLFKKRKKRSLITKENEN